MKLKQIKEADEKIIVFTQIKRLNKIVDKLEQRIATLEKVSGSHSKCIGELRGEEEIKLNAGLRKKIVKRLEQNCE